MVSDLTEAHSLASIDSSIGNHLFSPAQYEIVRRIIYHTGDFEYKSLIHFSPQALIAGSAAIAARSPIIVDVPMVQAGVLSVVKQTFINQIYCALDVQLGNIPDPAQIFQGMQTLAERYPQSIFIIGDSLIALKCLWQLIEEQKIQPALLIATVPLLLTGNFQFHGEQEKSVPCIYTKGAKGGATVAVAALDALIDLTWLAYEDKEK